jgi:hypothetical protein
MTDVSYTLNLSLGKYKIEKGRQVELCHILKAEVPVPLMHIWV